MLTKAIVKKINMSDDNHKMCFTMQVLSLYPNASKIQIWNESY